MKEAFRVTYSCLSILAAAAAVAAIPVGGADIDARIQRIEEGLRPGIAISGQPQTKWTIAERLKFYRVPGVSVAVIANGRVEWARGYGVVAEKGRRVDAETLFQAASISKPVSAMVALHLVDEGKLSLGEDVNLKLRSWKVPENEFTKTRKVTLQSLLNHSAGLTVEGFVGYAAGEPVPLLLDVLDGRKPANSPPIRVAITPGTAFMYSGGGYAVMQQLVTDVSGKPFPQLAQELVLGPLGMSHSTYEQPLPARFEANAAAGHEGDGTMRKGRWHTYPEIAAAGLWTTPSDLARVVLELQSGNRVLKPATRLEMLTKVFGNDKLGDCGLGIFLGESAGHKWFKHAGSNAGFKCIMFGYRDSGSGAVIMTNGNRGMALAEEILRSISAEYLWTDYKPAERAVVNVESGILRAYVGRYALLPGFEITVTYENGRLFATAQGNKMELFPESITNFFSVEAEMPPKVTFTRDSDGSIVMYAGGVTAKRQTGAPPARRR